MRRGRGETELKERMAREKKGSIAELVEEAGKPPECWGTRHTYVAMAFLGYTLCFTLR